MTVGLGLVIGGDGGRLGVDRQRALLVGDVVVGVGVARAGDVVGADVVVRVGDVAADPAQAVAGLQARHLEGERGIGLAVGLGLVIGGDGGRLGVDRQRALLVGDVVVGVGVARAGDVVGADVVVRVGDVAADPAQAVAGLQARHIGRAPCRERA